MNLEEFQGVGTRCAASARLLAGMFATLALAGCGLLPTTTIDAEDSRVILPSVRAGVNLTEGKSAPSEPRTGNAIEFGVAHARGRDSQSLAAGQPPIILNGTTFNPPQQLRNDFDFYFADISWRWRKFFGERSLGLEVLAGPAYSSLGLTVSSLTQRASHRFGTRGPQAGVGLIWRMQPTMSLQARVTGFISSADKGVNEMARFELVLAKALHENLTVRVGYAGWEVKGQGQVDMSDFRLRFSGLALGLDLNFD